MSEEYVTRKEFEGLEERIERLESAKKTERLISRGEKDSRLTFADKIIMIGPVVLLAVSCVMSLIALIILLSR